MMYSIKRLTPLTLMIGLVLALLFGLTLIKSTAVSAASFSITIISPNGGEIFDVGSHQQISWESDFGPSHIGLENEDGMRWIFATNVSGNSFEWTVDTYGMSGTQFKVYIVAQKNRKHLVTDISDASFTIKRPVTMLKDTTAYSAGVTVVDFSQFSGSGGLTDQVDGLTFTSDASQGWKTVYANGFITSASTAITLPGAPAGSSGTQITFDDQVQRAGFFIQAGAPFSMDNERPSKTFTLTAFDTAGNVLLEQSLSTCPEGIMRCLPQFVGVQSEKTAIHTIQLVFDEAYTYSMDDLWYETGTSLMSDQNDFGDSAKTESFTSLSGSGVLTTQLASNGLTFVQDVTRGLLTNYANMTIGGGSTAVNLPGAPTGMSGVEVNFATPVQRVGMQVQAGSPFNADSLRPAKTMTVTAFGSSGDVLFEQQVSTCPTRESQCTPQFIGVESVFEGISSVRYVMNDSYSYRMDDLVYESLDDIALSHADEGFALTSVLHMLSSAIGYMQSLIK